MKKTTIMNNWECSNCGEINEPHYDVCCKKCGKDIKDVFDKYQNVPFIKSPFRRFLARNNRNHPGSIIRIHFLRGFLFLVWIGFILTLIISDNPLPNWNIIVLILFINVLAITAIISLLIKFNNDLYKKKDK